MPRSLSSEWPIAWQAVGLPRRARPTAVLESEGGGDPGDSCADVANEGGSRSMRRQERQGSSGSADAYFDVDGDTSLRCGEAACVGGLMGFLFPEMKVAQVEAEEDRPVTTTWHWPPEDCNLEDATYMQLDDPSEPQQPDTLRGDVSGQPKELVGGNDAPLEGFLELPDDSEDRLPLPATSLTPCFWRLGTARCLTVAGAPSDALPGQADSSEEQILRTAKRATSEQ
mmetsp:Transcript_35918/g.75365  ORF Transcript_35918/g.75365 Transcript_35918/m.75365 type:complete len:227 (+) Transcript_35918:3-683(+)